MNGTQSNFEHCTSPGKVLSRKCAGFRHVLDGFQTCFEQVLDRF